MTEPSTGGVLCEKIEDMKVGDYCLVSYSLPSKIDTLSSTMPVGKHIVQGLPADDQIIPPTGYGSTADTDGETNWLFYFIMVEKTERGGLLVADRICQNQISWDVLNQNDLIQGAPHILDGIPGIIRSLGGGNSYADINGEQSLTQPNLSLGTWPTDNEWDKYILNWTMIEPGRTPDDVWHINDIYTWTQDTPINGTWTDRHGNVDSDKVKSNRRMVRGFLNRDRWDDISNRWSHLVAKDHGFRPVFEYFERSDH